MAPSKWFERWLAPEARRPDGSIWPRELDAKKPKKPPCDPGPPVRLRPSGIAQALNGAERGFLRTRLDQFEHDTAGAGAAIRLRRGDGRVGGVRCPAPAVSLVTRGLAVIRSQEGDTLLRLTETGRDALRAWLSTQPSNFRVRFPRLYAQLTPPETAVPAAVRTRRPRS